MRNSIFALLLASTSVCVFAAPPSPAQAPIQAKTQVHKVVVVTGKDTLVETPVMGLDDVVQYTIDYFNSSPNVIKQVQATFKIPANMNLVPGMIQPAPQQVLLSGQTEWISYPLPDNIAKQITAAQIQAVSWVIPSIEGKKTARIIVRCKLVQRPQAVTK